MNARRPDRHLERIATFFPARRERIRAALPPQQLDFEQLIAVHREINRQEAELTENKENRSGNR